MLDVLVAKLSSELQHLLSKRYGDRDGQIGLGDFVLINQFMIQLFMPLGFLGFVFREIKGSLANIERMFELIDGRLSIQRVIDLSLLGKFEGGRAVADEGSLTGDAIERAGLRPPQRNVVHRQDDDAGQ